MKFWLVVEVVESSSGRFGAGLLIIVPLLVFHCDLHLHQRSMLAGHRKAPLSPEVETPMNTWTKKEKEEPIVRENALAAESLAKFQTFLTTSVEGAVIVMGYL